MKRVLGDDWALPALDELNRAFFTAGVLTFQQCKKCSHIQHPPEDICEACQSLEIGRFESAGRGCVESVVVAHHPVHPRLVDQVPYAIVLVSVDDAPGILVAGNVTGTAAEAVCIGDAVRVVFEEVADPESGATLRIPQWKIASG